MNVHHDSAGCRQNVFDVEHEAEGNMKYFYKIVLEFFLLRDILVAGSACEEVGSERS